jgi:hypothetical protein
MTVQERIASKNWDGMQVYIPGMQPISIEPSELDRFDGDFIILKEIDVENEQGTMSVISTIKFDSIATIDFIKKSKIIGNKKHIIT